DYWRQHCYGLEGSALDWVDANWGTPDALRRRVAPLLAHAADEQGETSLAAILQASLAARDAELATIKAPWPAWSEVLRSLCDAACAAKRVNARKFQPRWYQPWFDNLAAWAADPGQAALDLGTGFQRLTP